MVIAITGASSDWTKAELVEQLRIRENHFGSLRCPNPESMSKAQLFALLDLVDQGAKP